MSKLLRDELIREFIAAIRASQTATDMFDHSVADYVGLDRTAYRCLDILDQEGPMTAGITSVAASFVFMPGTLAGIGPVRLLINKSIRH